jgi:hypothetical protein
LTCQWITTSLSLYRLDKSGASEQIIV